MQRHSRPRAATRSDFSPVARGGRRLVSLITDRSFAHAPTGTGQVEQFLPIAPVADANNELLQAIHVMEVGRFPTCWPLERRNGVEPFRSGRVPAATGPASPSAGHIHFPPCPPSTTWPCSR